MIKINDYFVTNRLAYWLVFFLGCLSTGLIFMTWHHFLDDAFIHLRIAKNLVSQGYYSFNGDEPTFSTSSPLYTFLLAIFWKIHPSFLIPKYINIAIYLLLFALVSNFVLAAKNSTVRIVSILWLSAIASPMGVRWLTDGMETVLVAIAGIALGKLASDIVNKKSTNSNYLQYFIVCFLAVMLRVEFLFLIAIILFGLALNLILNFSKAETEKLNVRPVLMLLGGIAGLFSILWVFGYVLPDTAVAKAGTMTGLSFTMFLEFFVNAIRVHLASSFFGVAMAICWLWSTFELVKIKKNFVYSIVLNTGFLILCFLIFLRHQALQGYRYFIFIEFFLTAYNIYGLMCCEICIKNRKFFRWVFLVACIVIAGWQIFDLTRLNVINSGRGLTFEKFSHTNFDYLNKKNGIAWDVGMIGFFTDSYILDPNGLVNGRKFSVMKVSDRLHIFSLEKVDFIFANQEQLTTLKPYLNADNWTEAGQYDFPNFNKLMDTHFLLVRRN